MPLAKGRPSRFPILPTIFGILSLSIASSGVVRLISPLPPMLALPIPIPCWLWLWCEWWWWWWWWLWLWLWLWLWWWLWLLITGVLLQRAACVPFLVLLSKSSSCAPRRELVFRTCSPLREWSQLLQRCFWVWAWLDVCRCSAFKLAATSLAWRVFKGETGVLSSSPVGGGVDRQLEAVEELQVLLERQDASSTSASWPFSSAACSSTSSASASTSLSSSLGWVLVGWEATAIFLLVLLLLLATLEPFTLAFSLGESTATSASDAATSSSLIALQSPFDITFCCCCSSSGSWSWLVLVFTTSARSIQWPRLSRTPSTRGSSLSERVAKACQVNKN